PAPIPSSGRRAGWSRSPSTGWRWSARTRPSSRRWPHCVRPTPTRNRPSTSGSYWSCRKRTMKRPPEGGLLHCRLTDWVSLGAEDLRTRRVVGRRRHDRQGQRGLIAVPRLEEGDHVVDLLVIELPPQLQASHDIHRFFQLPVGAVVEVGIGQLDVAQGRYLEVEPVRVLAGDGHTTFSRVV